jgi:hypothetical protein
MNAIDMTMHFANGVNLVAVLLLMRTVIKDRDALKGFSVRGIFLTLVAILGFDVGFFLMGNYVSLALGLVALTFWFMAFAFSLRNFFRLSKSQLAVSYKTVGWSFLQCIFSS